MLYLRAKLQHKRNVHKNLLYSTSVRLNSWVSGVVVLLELRIRALFSADPFSLLAS